MFSVGILYKCQELLRLARSTPRRKEDFEARLPQLAPLPFADVLTTVEKCRWAAFSHDAPVQLTPAGLAIASAPDYKSALRLQLRDLLETDPPPWAGLLRRGRRDLARFAQPDAVQCFKDAGLLDDADEAVALWWDEVARPLWNAAEQRRLEIGRKGEWLSFRHEEARIGRKPRWVALDNNGAGYDLLSSVDAGSTNDLPIEVKASDLHFEAAAFFLTRHEWETLVLTNHARIHLWTFDPAPRLFVIGVDDIKHHIPADCGSGEWQNVRIMFRSVVGEQP